MTNKTKLIIRLIICGIFIYALCTSIFGITENNKKDYSPKIVISITKNYQVIQANKNTGLYTPNAGLVKAKDGTYCIVDDIYKTKAQIGITFDCRQDGGWFTM
ncbi:MAG: hypothetical protein LBT85_00410 [Bifidobacteriaceae bacterium]|jgi:hypothetical protein|nr:hypothetical protein [Bifidobacteriaceae bacterium]